MEVSLESKNGWILWWRKIKHKILAKYTPESSGLVKRKDRTPIDMARSMLSEYNVSDIF
jgi:hypothetical protein